MALEAGNSGIIDVPPEVLQDTMNAVKSAMDQSAALSNACNNLIEDLLGAGAFKGAAATMAMQTIAEINTSMQKIIQHGTALADHLGTSAEVMVNNEQDGAQQFSSVMGSIKG
jgi:uncharacterized protein YukE